jgi:hypothetical protein
MADDDNIRITATRPARRRAFAGVRAGETPLGTIPDVIVFGHRRTLIPGSRRERLTAKRSRPEMAPQRLEKIESAPGNGMGSEASYPQYLVPGHEADRAAPGDGLRQ